MSVLAHGYDRPGRERRPEEYAPPGVRARPRRGDDRRPAGRAVPVSERAVVRRRGCEVRPEPRRWLALVAVGVVLCLAVAGLGLLANAFAPGLPERTTAVSVAPGETLWDLATRYAPGSDPEEVVRRIEQLNGVNAATVVPGLTLSVPYQG